MSKKRIVRRVLVHDGAVTIYDKAWADQAGVSVQDAINYAKLKADHIAEQQREQQRMNSLQLQLKSWLTS